MQKFNKATVSAIVGGVLTAVASIWPSLMTAEVVAAIQTVIVTIAVLLIPNVENK